MATILIDKNVMVSMRDGVRLATDVYRLDGTTPAPVLITHTPYDKERAVAGSDTFDILRAVQAGYAVVIQDVRGRYASEGEFDPMIHETRDGVDTFAWAAAQPWSRGVVGTFGKPGELRISHIVLIHPKTLDLNEVSRPFVWKTLLVIGSHQKRASGAARRTTLRFCRAQGGLQFGFVLVRKRGHQDFAA
jgi:hypothetical protein